MESDRSTGDLTKYLQQTAGEDESGSDEVIAQLYAELRTIAARLVARELPGNSLQPTALVHEAYIKLMTSGTSWENRRHFFGVAAETMRRILIDAARRRRSRKRGRGWGRVELSAVEGMDTGEPEYVESVDAALSQLERHRPRLAELVKLRFFAGMTIPQVAQLLEISVATANREWKYAKAWLLREMRDE